MEDKVAAVHAILNGVDLNDVTLAESDDGMGEDNDASHVQDITNALQQNLNSNIHPGLDHMVPPSPYVQAPAPMGHPMGRGLNPAIPAHMAQHIAQSMQLQYE